MSERSLDDWLNHIERLHPDEIEMGLERVGEVADRLDVRRPAPLSIIVAGTNGKGSTAVFAEALLREMGDTVGTTLSPHLERFNERVRLDGEPCDDATLCAAFAAVDAARGSVPLTYFEFAALVALLTFRDAGVDAAILEVGLGGRLDAFNIVDAEVAVVTSIGLDHTEYLGTDLEQIGIEKAGVLRRGQGAVLGAPVTRSVRDRAASLGCRVAEIGRDFTFQRSGEGWNYSSRGLSLEALPVGALAEDNCALAIRAVEFLTEGASRERAWGQLTPAVVAKALEKARLPGRCEVFEARDRCFVLDVAHNVAGADFLFGQLERRGMVPRVAIFGSLRDKDTAGVLGCLQPLLQRVICAGTGGGRGLGAEELAARVPPGIPHESAADTAAALAIACSLTAPGDVILAFGSFALVGQVRSLLEAPGMLTAHGHN